MGTDVDLGAPTQGKTVDVSGVRTHYHDVGAGDPVLLLHGSGPGVSAWANWKMTVGPLSESFRVIAPDMVGFGYTERPDMVNYGPATWVQHVVDFIDALELDRVHVVGNSLGARIALGIALEHPARLDRLVLMGAGVLRRETTAALATTRQYEPSPAAMRAVLEGFAYDRSIVTQAMVEERYRASIEPGAQEAYVQMFRDRTNSGNETTLEESVLTEVSAPTLIVHGFDDKVIPYGLSIRITELIPDAQLHLFKQCGHWAQLEHAVQFNDLLVSFLSMR
jgi:2-hydroxymuconate-semialdehyde hydrolase